MLQFPKPTKPLPLPKVVERGRSRRPSEVRSQSISPGRDGELWADRLPPVLSGRRKTSPVAARRQGSARTPSPTTTKGPLRAPSIPTAAPTAGFIDGLSDGAVSDAEGLSGAEDPTTARKKKKKARIRVVVRKRPLNEREGGEDCVACSTKECVVEAVKQRVDLTEYTESHEFAFDAAYDVHQRTNEVYEACARELIDCVFDGGSASCFAYGQTGSGKTHTMIGNDSEPGLYIMAAEDIFDRVQPHHRVFVSLFEIYCNSLFDLLNGRAVVVAREDANKRVNICGLTWHEIESVQDLTAVMDHGAIQRRTGSTSANEFSSRSHAVLTITVRDETQPKFLGSLNVVDLAGSERAADTAANDKQTRLEGAEINKSLLALKECIRGLDERKKHVPFRGSKLTEVLRDSFVGNSRTVMIATISPSTTNAEHTLNTLRYAFRVKGLSIECPMPSKERNAPRPTQRARSTEPTAMKEREDKRRERKEKKDRKDRKDKDRHSRARTGRSPFRPSLAVAAENDAMRQVVASNSKLKEELQEVRATVAAVQEQKQRDTRVITELQENVGELQKNNEALMKMLEEMSRLHDLSPSRPNGGKAIGATQRPGDRSRRRSSSTDDEYSD